MAPLHLAIHTYAGLEVIQTLISYDRQVVRRHSRHPDFRVSGYESDESDMNGDGWVLPVHLAAWNSTPVKVVQVLVESYPPSIVKQDQEHNRAPLHWALVAKERNEDNIKTITYLLKKCPRVTTFGYDWGIIPNMPIGLEIRRHKDLKQINQDRSLFFDVHGHEMTKVYLDSFILITLIRMYLSNDYPEEKGYGDLNRKFDPDEKYVINWEAGNEELKKNMIYHVGNGLNYELVVQILEEMAEHEKLFEQDISTRNRRCSDEVIRLFLNYRKQSTTYIFRHIEDGPYPMT
jgi:hypothetical protein